MSKHETFHAAQRRYKDEEHAAQSKAKWEYRTRNGRTQRRLIMPHKTFEWEYTAQ